MWAGTWQIEKTFKKDKQPKNVTMSEKDEKLVVRFAASSIQAGGPDIRTSRCYPAQEKRTKPEERVD